MPIEPPDFPSTLSSQRLYPLDLHLHSTASDGAMDPAAVVRLCAQRGLKAIALTDHDTMSGCSDAASEAARLGLQLLPGVELSTRWQGIGIHLVALLPDGPRGLMRQGLEHQALARKARAEVIASRMEKLGLNDAMAKARAQAPSGRALGRPDFARALIEAGIARDWSDAFKRFLGSGKRGDVKAQWPDIRDAVGWVEASGGVAVLAHPLRYKLTRRKRGLLLDCLADAGGDAVELVNGQQNPDATRDLARQLDERGLYASFGSDFHFPGGHAAPGSMSAVPRTQARPIWTHPRLAPCFDSCTLPASRRHDDAVQDHKAQDRAVQDHAAKGAQRT